MDRSSLFKLLGLPESFGVVVLSFSFIILLAPYFSGADFGLFKIPNFTQEAKKWLKIIGPVVFLVCLLSFVPFFSVEHKDGAHEANKTLSPSSTVMPGPSPPLQVMTTPSPAPSASQSTTQIATSSPTSKEVKQHPDTDNVKAAITGAQMGYITFQQKPLPSFIIALYITNSGETPVVLNSIKVKAGGTDKWDDQVVLHPQNENIYSPNPFSFSIEPKKPRSFQIFYPTDKQADYFKEFTIRVGYIDSNASTKYIDISNQ